MPGFQWRIDVAGRYLDQDIVNTYMYVLAPGPIAVPAAEQREIIQRVMMVRALAAAFIDTWQIVYTSISVDECVYRLVRVTQVSPFVPERYGESFPVNWQSGRMVQGLPPNISAIVTRRWGNGSRQLNGRVFYGAIAAEDESGGLIVTPSDTWTAMGLAQARMTLAINNGGFTFSPAVINFRDPANPVEPYPAREVVLSQRVPRLASQRRRLPGHGAHG